MAIDPIDIAAAGGTVLTANKRLARQLVHQFDRQQISSGQSVWTSPAIFSLDAWLMRLLSGMHRQSVLLTDVQSQYLWAEIIATDGAAAGRDLLQVAQTAQRARDAHRLLGAYLTEMPPTGLEEEHQAFLRWRRIWQARLGKNGWLDRGDLLQFATKVFVAGQFPPPPALVLAGFDDLSPALRKLCDTLETCGCRVAFWEAPTVPNGRPLKYAAADMADEVRSCARWARTLLERDPQCRIGVVAPQLADYQPLIERIFREEFAPATCLVGGDGHEPFSLSLGTPLAKEGVVCAAMHLLAVTEAISMDDISYLLRSPYLGGAQTEWAERARADRELRRRGRCEWQLGAMSRALGGHAPRMATIIEKLLAAGKGARRRFPGEWAEHFAELLESCGWPGHRGINSREYQAVNHFKGILGQLATLDRVAEPMARGQARSLLTQLAAETIFQPESEEGRIQVLGMLEAAGFTFDALWIVGLHEKAFPAPPRPNPFLPLVLQSRMHMPHADAVREREFSGRLASRLFAAAPDVVASWPGQLDGAGLRPSPFIRDLPAECLTLAPSCDPFQAVLAAPCRLESLSDERAAVLPADRVFTGGTGVLTDQALCPFRAFAHHRLHAEQLATTDLGLDNLARGSLAHGVLERFWQRVRTQEALLVLDASRQDALLELAAEETLAQYERHARQDLPPKVRRLERQRLKAMAAGWLALERTRSPFRVAEIEQWHEAAVGHLKLRTRVDRIDELADGMLAIIDYKTGRPNPQQWFDDRVTEPQLPLYCLSLERSRIGAVLFALIRSREKECAFKGVARAPADWPKLSANTQKTLLAERGWSHFDEVVAHWRKVLPALGDAFVAGLAAVDPVDPQQACKYCDLPLLCRIGERGTDFDADGGDALVDE